jgi:hypothetical protein
MKRAAFDIAALNHGVDEIQIEMGVVADDHGAGAAVLF